MNDGFVNPNDYVSGSRESELYSVFYHSTYWKDADNGKTYPPDTDIRQYHKESGRTGKSEGPSGLKYRFSSAPVVRSVNRTTCTVTCEFTAFLDGGLD